MTDAILLGNAYDFHLDKVWPRTPEITADDIKLFLEQITQANKNAVVIDSSSLIYNSTVMDVVRSGFAARLYGGQKNNTLRTVLKVPHNFLLREVFNAKRISYVAGE